MSCQRVGDSYQHCSSSFIIGEFGIGLYNEGMETLPGPEIKVKACHSLNNNYKHKRTADNHVNPDIDST